MKTISFILRNLYFAFIIVTILVLSGMTIAQYTANKASHSTLYTDRIEPVTPGHAINIIGSLTINGQPISGGGSSLPTCASGQILKYGTSGWACAADSTGQTTDDSFGWITTDSNGNPLEVNSIYTVSSDGFILFTTGNDCCPSVVIDIGPHYVPDELTVYHGRGYSGGTSITVPIPKGYLFRIRYSAPYSGSSYIRWVPIGDGKCQKAD